MKKLLTAFVLCLCLTSGRLLGQTLSVRPKNLNRSDTIEVLLNLAVANKIAYINEQVKVVKLSDSLKSQKKEFAKTLKSEKRESKKKGFKLGATITFVVETLVVLYFVLR